MRNFIISISLMSFLMLSGCGTIFYPENRGKTSNINVTVAVLDGIGLIFFVIPGVIAYAVDFTTGAIYLSGRGGKAKMAMIQLDKNHALQPQINEIIDTNYGVTTKNAYITSDVVAYRLLSNNQGIVNYNTGYLLN